MTISTAEKLPANQNELTTNAIGYVCRLVEQESAIELDESKAYMIEARLGTLARQKGFPSISKLVEELIAKNQRTLVEQVVDAMTTNETSFYRDIHPFDAMTSEVIPEFMKLRAGSKTLNIWSAACSSGQELYSIGMLLKDNFPELLNWNVNLRGTDLSDEILEKPKKGIFTQAEVNRRLSTNALIKHFTRKGMKWKLNDDIKEMGTFSRLNLIDFWPQMPLMDIVFLRNVLIYFSPEVKRKILSKIRKVMAPDGLLFLGGSETTVNLDDSYSRQEISSAVGYRLQ